MCGHKDVECMQKKEEKSGVYIPKSIEAPEWARERVKGMEEWMKRKCSSSAHEVCVCVMPLFFISNRFHCFRSPHKHSSKSETQYPCDSHTFLDSMEIH